MMNYQSFSEKIRNNEEIIEAGKKLRAMGSENVIISMGKEGSILISEKGVYKGNAPKGKLISSVGAGDSMVAGVTYGLIKWKRVRRSIQIWDSIRKCHSIFRRVDII